MWQYCQCRNVAKPLLNKICTKSITALPKYTGKGGCGAVGCIKLEVLTTEDWPYLLLVASAGLKGLFTVSLAQGINSTRL